MKDKKIYIILVAIAVVSAIIIAVMGLNVSLRYSPAKQVQFNIGKEFDNKEVKNIVKEVMGNQEIIIRKVETFEEIVEITVKDITEEQANEIKNKLYEKYDVDDSKEEIEIVSISNVRMRDIIRPYVLPIGISLAIVLVYAGIRFRKIEILEVLGTILGLNIFAELVYVCVLAITRLPVNVTTIPVGLTIYIVTTLVIINDFEKRQEKIGTKTKKNK